MTKSLALLPKPAEAHKEWGLRCCQASDFSFWWAVAVDTGNVMSKEMFCRDAIDPEAEVSQWCLLMKLKGQCSRTGGPPRIEPYSRQDDVAGYKHRRIVRHPGRERAATG